MRQICADTELDCDVVIVGSGCGGGVVAAELSGAGYRVLVLEKGKFYQPCEFTQDEAEAIENMYDRGGATATEDGAISILAADTFGGGSTINWSCSLVTPGFVREEWANEYGLHTFLSPEFDRSVNAVCSRISVQQDKIQHNRANRLLLDGCRKLGYDSKVCPQNITTADTEAAYIPFGDRSGKKQSAPVTFFEDAARCGAEFIDCCKVSHVTHNNGIATGVEAVVSQQPDTQFRLRVNAKIVVCSGGSLHSPALLLRSRIQNDAIGKNLRLHPVTGMFGHFPGEPVDMDSGPPMTTVCNEVAAGTCGDFYGAKLEIPSTHPALFASATNWTSGAQFKDMMTKYRKTMLMIVLARDSGSGTVQIDASGDPRLHYTLAPHDQDSLVEGLVKSARILVSAGAEKIGTQQWGVPDFNVNTELGAADPKLAEWINQIKSVGVKPLKTDLFSAHQMGSCRMGSSRDGSVVDSNGQSWDVKNLFVADASTFPTPSGANPMITTMSIAHLISQRIKMLHPRSKL